MRKHSLILGAIALAVGLSLNSTASAQVTQGALTTLDVPVPQVTKRSALMRHSESSRILHVSVSLPYGDQGAMESYADSVSDPTSPNYRAFLTPDEIGARFGLPMQFVQKVRDYLTGQGFKVTLVGKNRLGILAEGTVQQAERAFHTTINDYGAYSPSEPGNPYYFAFSQPLRVPAEIARYVQSVQGLENFTKPQMRSTLNPTLTRALYGLAPIYNGGLHGEGRTVAISNFDGYRLSNLPLYYSQYGLPAPSGGVGSNVHVVTVSGGAGTGTAQGEGDLDIQMVLGIAPLCNFYIYDGGGSDIIGVLTREVNDNLADVISESYGWGMPASMATSAHNLHLSMTAQGITYMGASGDSGTTIEPYSYPDYDPEVLMVGGSSASVDSSGNRLSEVGWNSGGGGWSTNTATFNVLPSWQHGTGVPTSVNHRLVPDVALHASGTQTTTAGAYSFYYNGSLTSGYVGTSFACPVFAGSLALAEQKIISLGGLPSNGAGKQRFGRVQDLFYSQNMRSDVWYDITSGANGNLPDNSASTAHAGWDYVCGLGVINFNAFVATQGVSSSPDFTFAASPGSQTVVQGSGTSYSANTTALNGFSGTVSLTVSGLPSGASASFSPTSIAGTGSSTLSVSTAAATPAGTYTLTLTGTSGSIVHTATVSLVVTASNLANFTLTATPSSRTIRRGLSTTYSIGVAAKNGFTGKVTFSLSGAPATFTFNPSSVTRTGTSTLTVRTTTATTRRTYTLTVTGVSGSLTHSATVTLVVQ